MTAPQRFTDRLRKADRLQDDAPQFLEERRCRVSLIVLLLANAPGEDEATVFQFGELALGRPGTCACGSDQFGGIEAAPRLAKEHAQDALLGPGQERIGEACSTLPAALRLWAQYGQKHALFGNDGQSRRDDGTRL